MSKTEQKPIVERFTEALGEGVESSFNRLASEIMKESVISSRDKALIALACSVAIRCEHCVKRHKEIARMAGAGQREMLEAAAIAGLVRMGSGFNAAEALLEEF